jgi:hypothetical protein
MRKARISKKKKNVPLPSKKLATVSRAEDVEDEITPEELARRAYIKSLIEEGRM